jgi:hypothetical protein
MSLAIFVESQLNCLMIERFTKDSRSTEFLQMKALNDTRIKKSEVLD